MRQRAEEVPRPTPRAKRRLWGCESHGRGVSAPVLAQYIQGCKYSGGFDIPSKQVLPTMYFVRSCWWLALVCVIFWAPSTWAQEGPTAIYVMNADGSAARQLIQVDGYSTHSFPRWSHDARSIVFDAMPKAGQRELFLMNAEGAGLRQARHRVDPLLVA